nr:hypothetical protein [Anaerolineae bacterium]
AQQRLVQALPPDKTVAVALFSPFDWMSFPGVSAYLTTYSPLPEAIPAACAVLFGAAPARGTLPVSLAGVRDFDNGGAQLADGSALSLLPRRAAAQATISPDQTQVALLFSAPATPTPMPSPLPTETLAPLDSTRRPQATPVTPTVVAAIVQPLPTIALAPEGTDAPAASFDWGMLGWVGVLLAGVGLVVIGARTRRPAAKPSGAARPPVKAKPTPDAPKPNRPPVKAKPAPEAPKPTASPVADSDNGVFLARCVVCNQPSLTRQGKRIQCGACHSLLRQQDGGRWLVRVNPSAPPEVIARLNDKTFSEAELRRIERDHQR